MSDAPNLERDPFPIMGYCKSCGAEILYSPIRMPTRAPILNPEKPGHFVVEYIDMCVDCVEREVEGLRKKILAGEMYPVQSWDWNPEAGRFQIVSLSKPIPTEGRKVGILQRIFRWFW